MFTGLVGSTILAFGIALLPATPQVTSSGELYPEIIQEFSYVVKPGDSLESIAQEFPLQYVQSVSYTYEASSAPTVVQQTTPVANAASGPLSDAQITFLGTCESGMRPATNTGNGYFGAFQFTIGTWNSMGTGYARADLAPLEVQKDAVQRLLTRSSIWTQFPGCAAKMKHAGLL